MKSSDNKNNNSKEGQSDTKPDDSPQKDEKSKLHPPLHVFALREIVVSDNAGEGGEHKNKECQEIDIADNMEESARPLVLTSPGHHPPRMITSRVVLMKGSVYQQLEEESTGTVLCCPSPSIRNDTTNVDDHLYFDVSTDLLLPPDAEGECTNNDTGLQIEAIPALEIWQRMIGDYEDEHRSCKVTTNCPVPFGSDETNDGGTGTQKDPSNKSKRSRKKISEVPGKMYRSMKKRVVRRTRKKQRAPGEISRTKACSKCEPRIIINNGIIDWENSQLDHCQVISHASYSISGMNTTESSLGSTIFGENAVIYNSIKPSECNEIA